MSADHEVAALTARVHELEKVNAAVAADNAELVERLRRVEALNNVLTERIAVQAELLAKAAEKTAAYRETLEPLTEFVRRCGLIPSISPPDAAEIAIASGKTPGNCLTLGNLRRIVAFTSADPEPPAPGPPPAESTPVGEMGPVPPGEMPP